MRPHGFLTLLVCTGVAACATPAQVRRLETQMQIQQAQQARVDSVRAADLARLSTQLRGVLDSMTVMNRAFSDALAQLARNNEADLTQVQNQLTALLAANRTAALSYQTLRSELQNQAVTGTVAPTDSSRSGEGPEALWTAAQNQESIGNLETARGTYTQIITQYPTSDRVSDALFGVGRIFATKNQADSARTYFKQVFTKYPKAVHAPSAMYQLAVLEERLGNNDVAQQYYKRVVAEYKDSNEASIAAGKIRPPA